MHPELSQVPKYVSPYLMKTRLIYSTFNCRFKRSLTSFFLSFIFYLDIFNYQSQLNPSDLYVSPYLMKTRLIYSTFNCRFKRSLTSFFLSFIFYLDIFNYQSQLNP